MQIKSAVTVGLAALALSACTSGTPGVPDEPSPPRDVTVRFAELTLSMQVPGRFGEGYLGGQGGDECPVEEYNWSRLPSGEDAEVLSVGTTTRSCPDKQAVNGEFPTWSRTADLPDDATKSDTPAGDAHSFSFRYTQCTNECSEYTYDVVFVELPDKRSFWIQSSGIDSATITDIVATVKVR